MKQVIELLNDLESAPGAVHLVASIANIELDYEPYEASEGFNDTKTEEIVNNMDSSQISDLISTLKSSLEFMREEDPEYYQENFGDEDPLLSDLFK